MTTQEIVQKLRCGDPACGTFGFMIAADHYIKGKTDELFSLKERDQEFQRKKAFSGVELVQDAYRLALMNAMLHDIEGEILPSDALSNAGKAFKDYDVILTNPPFGTKKGGERPTRDDLTYPSSNKQLNFLQVIYRSLRPNGKTRAAVVLPDNVLFQEDDGQKVRAYLMNKCNLYTILRLPTGIFYAQGVKTNVLFFSREKTDKDNTKEVRFYDLRTNMPSFGVRTPLTEEYFKNFELAYNAKDRHKHKDPEDRWSVLSREQIKAKGDNLDQGLIADNSVKRIDELVDPAETAEEAIGKLEEAVGLLHQVVKELRQTGVGA